MNEQIIKYTQYWDYHTQHHIQLINDCNCVVASGYISENQYDTTINGIYVNENFRGKGYGKMIIKALINLVEELGFDEVWLMVNKSNLKAIKVFESEGFNIEQDTYYKPYYWMKRNIIWINKK